MDLVRTYARSRFDVQGEDALDKVVAVLETYRGAIEEWMANSFGARHPDYPDEVDEQIRDMLMRLVDDDTFREQWYKEGW